MKLIEIKLAGFGKLVDRTFQFAPGLNLIFGPNEAGKSTLQRAILAMLYGLLDESARRNVSRELVSAYHPWEPRAEYAGVLSYTLNSGESFEARRVFDPKPCTSLHLLPQGQDISRNFKSGTQGRLAFADEHLGMSLTVFENTCYVQRAELVSLEKSASVITDTLLRLSASGSKETTTTQALNILTTILREEIGTDRSWSKPLPKAHARLRELDEERSRTLRERQTLLSSVNELNQLRGEIEKLTGETEETEYLQLLAQYALSNQQRLAAGKADEDVRNAQAELQQHQAWANFPIHLRTSVQEKTAQRAHTQGEMEKARQQALQAFSKLQQWSGELDALAGQSCALWGDSPAHLVDLPTLDASMPASQAPELRRWIEEALNLTENILQRSRSQWEDEGQGLIALQKLGLAGLADFRQQLSKAEHSHSREEQALVTATQEWQTTGIPEGEWEKRLETLEIEVRQREQWAAFPVHLRDELLILNNQRTELYTNLKALQATAPIAQEKLVVLRRQTQEVQARIEALETARSVPLERAEQIQSMASQTRNTYEVLYQAQVHLESAQADFQRQADTLEKEKQALAPVIMCGQAGLLELQQRWAFANQQVFTALQKLADAQEAWNKVGMPKAEYEKLEQIVREIQSGVRVQPKPRKGCRSLLSVFRPSAIPEQPATELVIYSQIQPIYTSFATARSEAESAQVSLLAVEREALEKLGELTQLPLSNEKFVNLGQRLAAYQQENAALAVQKEQTASLQKDFEQARARYDEVSSDLRAALADAGFVHPNLAQAVQAYTAACEQKKNLLQEEALVERLKLEFSPLAAQVQGWQTALDNLHRIETQIQALLQKAGIECDRENIVAGVAQFQAGVENYGLWQKARNQRDQAQLRYQPLYHHLQQARQSLDVSDKMLTDLKTEIAEQLSIPEPGQIVETLLVTQSQRLNSHLEMGRAVQSHDQQFERARLQAQEIQRDLSAWDERQKELRLVEDTLQDVFAQAGIQSGLSIDDGLAQFEQGAMGYQKWAQAGQKHATAVQTQQSLAEGLTQALANLAEVEKRIASLQRKHAEWKSLVAQKSPQEYDVALHDLRERLSKAHQDQTRLQETINRQTGVLRHPAEIDEEISIVRDQIQHLQFMQQALEMAHSGLEKATQEFNKQFAPRLERIMSEGLSQITRDRYSRVRVNPDTLAVTLSVPEHSEWVSAENLSTGTRDLVYLILRISLARLMSNTGEKLPLLLDDPLVQYDVTRTYQALEYLRSIAEETQVFLFTKDDGAREWFEDTCSSDPTHHLHRL